MVDFDTLLAEAREHLDRLDGTLVPEFVQVVDGWYSSRMVLDEVPDCVELVSWDSLVPVAILCHEEPCHIPRYRTEVRWRPSNGL